jgi:hypothetical protein
VKRPGWGPIAAFVALAGFTGLLWLEDFAPHTDDGCQVEVHCLACRASVLRPSSARARVDPSPILVAVAAAALPHPSAALVVFRASFLTRGPPRSS